MEKHRRRVMAPKEAHSAPQNRRDLSPAGAVVRKGGTVHRYNDKSKTDCIQEGCTTQAQDTCARSHRVSGR